MTGATGQQGADGAAGMTGATGVGEQGTYAYGYMYRYGAAAVVCILEIWQSASDSK